ncbi:hypothetical protein [Flavivirga rizhaonensis]|uniref:BZIP transcription factor n=1 Tax=Flavivirga rizhaonensis TaxID=2559571 RepID=A0A4S1DWR0_9FLAO|nr:hypothetical protein [Flavivirga rizhaonensis]TGV02557.1 hypothetical protein EM932_10295 [Flavivirga rizhaonensis]
MKKIFLLSFLITMFSYSQVTDENGVLANGNGGVDLNGKIIIGNPSIGGNDADPNNKNVVFNTNGKSAIFNLSDIYLFTDTSVPWEGMYMGQAGSGDIRLAMGAGTLDWSLGIDNSDGSKFKIEHDAKVSDDGYAIAIDANNDVDFKGNIGIGTTTYIDVSDGNKEYKLSVNGHVRAESVKVYTNWADFVFESNYELPTLEEVENYINENGHLKDVPSAKDVEENGIELGQMNKLLLQKIEELTLYTIELKKEVELLKKNLSYENK